MRRNFIKIAVVTLIISALLVGGLVVYAAQEGEYERNLSQSVTATVGDKTLNAITDPVIYWEVASGAPFLFFNPVPKASLPKGHAQGNLCAGKWF